MKRYTIYAVAALVMAVTLACGDRGAEQAVTTTSESGSSTAPPASEAESRDHALVRVIHAIPDHDTADIFTGENKAFPNVTFKMVTAYKEVPGEPTVFRLHPAAHTSTALVEISETLAKGRRYTVIALPANNGAEADIQVVEDRMTGTLGEAKAKVRLINASPDAGEIELYALGKADPLLDGIGFGSDVDYIDVDQTMGVLEVRAAGQASPALRLQDLKLEPGKFYTIVVVGRAKGSPRLEAITLWDEFSKTETRGSL
jgi:hypothetical protein